MKILALSGGGAYGAWGGGICSRLTSKKAFYYDQIIGTSTGALLAPLIMLGEFERLEKAYTECKQNDIFNVNPINNKGGLKIGNLLWRLLTNKKTLGESINLRTLIKKFFTIEDYNKIKNSSKELIFCVYNVDLSRVEYKKMSEYSYEVACDYIWASACIPIIMSLVKIGEYTYTDGGVADHIPIQYILNEIDEVEHIDIVIHRSEYKKPNTKITNILTNIFYSLEAFSLEISKSDLIILYKYNDFCDINLYYMVQEPDFKSSQFIPNKMKQLWISGEKMECFHKFIPKN